MKHLKYLSYVFRHKWYVFLECIKYGLWWQGIIHDLSKFYPSEWIPYAEYFYGNKDKKAFNVAWNHHIHRNPHHWQYWILTFDEGFCAPMPMPDRYIQEMVADWKGANKLLSKTGVVKWYEENREKIKLHHTTRKKVEALLGIQHKD